MKKLTLPFIAIALLTGCAQFKTTQTDETLDANGKVTGRTTTRISAVNFFQSKSELSKVNVSQTAKTQSTKVGAIAQEANSTNALATLDKIAEIIKALPK